MGWWTDFKDWANDKIDDFSSTDPSNNPYADVDRNNYELPDFRDRANYANEQMRGAQGRGAYTARDSSFRGDQSNLMGMYRNMYNDDAQSLALRQGERDRAASTAQQRSLMASASPNNAAMMARVGSQNIGRADQGITGNAMMGRIAERQGLANSMGSLAATGRAQDQGMNQFNAQQQMANRAQNDAAAQGWYGAATQNAGLQQQGGMNYEAQRGQRFATVAGQPTGKERVAAGLGGFAAGLVPGLAEGGIVTRPTQAVVGEAGPEAVIPLAKLPDLIRMAGQYLRTPNGAETAERDARENQAYRARAQAGQTGPEGPPAPYQVTEANEDERRRGILAQHRLERDPPTSGQEADIRNQGARWRAMRESGRDKELPGGERAMFQGGVPNMTQAQWLQFLRGLGVQ